MKSKTIRYTSLTFIYLLLTISCYTQPKWKLEKWTEVYGEVDGEYLGKHITAVPPNQNFPYKVVISSGNYFQGNHNLRTAAHTLNSPVDTNAKATYRGENMIIGDLNDDGHVELVVKTTASDTTNPLGYVWDTVRVYWGTPTGVDTLAPLLISAEESHTALIPALIGDINNDGKPDLILRAPGVSQGRGKVYIYLNPVVSSIPDYVLTGDSVGYALGWSVAIGDLNNDTFKDIIIRGGQGFIPRYDYTDIYWGIGKDTVNTVWRTRLKSSFYSKNGLACFDVNGDGIDDLLWANPDTTGSWIYVHFGKSGTIDSLPSLRLRNPGVGDFGSSIINAGDMNGDGYDDIAVAAAYASQTSGYVFIFGGGPKIDYEYDGGIGFSLDSRFGTSVAALGDVNGDGLSDLIIGAPEYDFGNDKGYWGVFLGDTNITVTAVESDSVQIPQSILLNQNYPNPFNPSTVISYRLPVNSKVAIKVYGMLGEEIATLINEELHAGEHKIEFNAEKYNLSSGVYYYRINAVNVNTKQTFTQTKQMLFLK